MIVAAFYTLYNLRGSLIAGISKAIKDIGAATGGGADRTDVDLDVKKVFAAIGVMASRNLVHSAMFLVLAFATSAVLWLMLESEFLAMTLVLV